MSQYPFFTCSQETFRIDSYSFDQEVDSCLQEIMHEEFILFNVLQRQI